MKNNWDDVNVSDYDADRIIKEISDLVYLWRKKKPEINKEYEGGEIEKHDYT